MNLPLTTIIDLFATTKQTEGKSDRTIDWYINQLTAFGRYLENGSDKVLLSDISLENARAFVAHLQQRTTKYPDHHLVPEREAKLSPFTIHGYVRALKAFSGCLYEEGFTNNNLFAKLKRPRLPQPMIEILSEDEIAAIFKAINPNTFLGCRLNVIMLILLDTGIRANELCTLTLDNTHVDQNYIKVVGKGNKERIVPFGTTTKKAIILYTQTARSSLTDADDTYLILSARGTPLTYDGLTYAFRRLGKRSGVERLHPHLCRHTFAVRYLMNGGDIMTLRLILGHTTLQMTQNYMHLAESHVKVQHNKFSPMDRLGIERKRKVV